MKSIAYQRKIAFQTVIRIFSCEGIKGDAAWFYILYQFFLEKWLSDSVSS